MVRLVAIQRNIRQASRTLRGALVLCCVAHTSCSLQPRGGDGLVTDSDIDSYEFGEADAPSVDGSAEASLRSCINVATFEEQVTPYFVEHCVECHDGTKLKAALGLDMFEARSSEPDAQQYTCDITLTLGLNGDDLLESTIFTEVDPDRTEVEHEFKFPDAESFEEYRDAVLIWAETE